MSDSETISSAQEPAETPISTDATSIPGTFDRTEQKSKSETFNDTRRPPTAE